MAEVLRLALPGESEGPETHDPDNVFRAMTVNFVGDIKRSSAVLCDCDFALGGGLEFVADMGEIGVRFQLFNG